MCPQAIDSAGRTCTFCIYLFPYDYTGHMMCCGRNNLDLLRLNVSRTRNVDQAENLLARRNQTIHLAFYGSSFAICPCLAIGPRLADGGATTAAQSALFIAQV
jgi:hypothetical protein